MPGFSRLISMTVLAVILGQPAFAGDLVEPSLHLSTASATAPHVALTLDACMGQTDQRILKALVENRIPATIFATALWLRRNPEAVAVLKAHPDLFEVENHGARHIPAVDTPRRIYGIESAGTPEAVRQEVEGGAAAFTQYGLPAPRWFRGATALYSRSAIDQIRAMGFRVAGFSINGDGGSLLGARETTRRISAARNGDVIISHINQPTHAAGAGVVDGILALKAKGYIFIRLDEMEEVGSDGTA